MALATSNKSALYWKVEASYGVAPSGNYNTQPINNESLDESIDTVVTDDIVPSRENPALRGGNIVPGGSITHDLSPNRSVYLFRHMLCGAFSTGAVSAPSAIAASTAYNRGDYVLAGAGGAQWICRRGGTTPGTVTGLLTGTGIVELTGGTIWEYAAANGVTRYEHIVQPGISWPATGLTFEKAILGGNANLFLQYLGCRINGVEISVPQNGPVKASWSVLPKNVVAKTSTGAGTPTLLAEDFFMGFDAYVHINDTQGAGGKVHQSFSANYSNGAQEDVFCIGERYRTDIPEGRKSYGGQLSMYFADRTEYDLFKNETQVAMMLTLIRRGEMIKIEWPEVKLTGQGSPQISGNGALTQNFSWTAFYQSGISKPWLMTFSSYTIGSSLPQ